jgi:hypothetical protein
MTIRVTRFVLVTLPRQRHGWIQNKHDRLLDTVNDISSQNFPFSSSKRVLHLGSSYDKPYSEIMVCTMDCLKNNSLYDDDPPITANLPAELLEACHDLDIAICGSDPASRNEIRSWHTLDPFIYLTSPIILTWWETNLATLCQQYREGIYTPNTFEAMLNKMLPAVDTLEGSRAKLESHLKELGVFRADICAVEELYDGVEKRCKILEESFKGLEMEL